MLFDPCLAYRVAFLHVLRIFDQNSAPCGRRDTKIDGHGPNQVPGPLKTSRIRWNLKTYFHMGHFAPQVAPKGANRKLLIEKLRQPRTPWEKLRNYTFQSWRLVLWSTGQLWKCSSACELPRVFRHISVGKKQNSPTIRSTVRSTKKHRLFDQFDLFLRCVSVITKAHFLPRVWKSRRITREI